VTHKRVHHDLRREFDSLVDLVCWLLWKERNARVFNHVSMTARQVSDLIRDEGLGWVVAGYAGLVDFL
jgi:hypothetical protein